MFILWEQRFTKGSGKRHPTYLSCSRGYRKERLVDFPGDVMWTRHLPDNLTSFWLLSALLATWRASCHAPPSPPNCSAPSQSLGSLLATGRPPAHSTSSSLSVFFRQVFPLFTVRRPPVCSALSWLLGTFLTIRSNQRT